MRGSYTLPTLGLLTLTLLHMGGWNGARVGNGPSWPSWTHPLGRDAWGRDFLGVMAEGAAQFTGPSLLAVGILVLSMSFQCALALRHPVLSGVGPSSWGALALASPPRLLVVMLVLLLLPEPSPWVASLVITLLYLPVALDESREVLQALSRIHILSGLVAHGISGPRLLFRHLLGGHLRDPLIRHASLLASQVAFTQISLAFLVGASATDSGLGSSWGVEMQRLSIHLPGPGGLRCDGISSCGDAIALFHVSLLLAGCHVLLGGLVRTGIPSPRGSR